MDLPHISLHISKALVWKCMLNVAQLSPAVAFSLAFCFGDSTDKNDRGHTRVACAIRSTIILAQPQVNTRDLQLFQAFATSSRARDSCGLSRVTTLLFKSSSLWHAITKGSIWVFAQNHLFTIDVDSRLRMHYQRLAIRD